MSDSNGSDHLDTKHERDRQQRIESIKCWIDYIKSEPPETWGPQQNAIVNDQLEAAQSIETTAAHHQHVQDVTAEILEISDESDAESTNSPP